MKDRDRLIELIKQGVNHATKINTDKYIRFKWCDVADYLLANGVIVPAENETVETKKKVYFPFPIDCQKCPKVVADIGVCEELDLLYSGKHPKYTKEQDWEFMCKNCPHEVTERKYEESDEKHIGKTVFLTKEEAEQAFRERSGDNGNL